jgi:predicted kinase
MALEVVVLIGIPASGKTTFFQAHFSTTHVHISKDNFRHNQRPSERQTQLIEEALASGRSVCIDNTNVARSDRRAILDIARKHCARTIGSSMASTSTSCPSGSAAERA